MSPLAAASVSGFGADDWALIATAARLSAAGTARRGSIRQSWHITAARSTLKGTFRRPPCYLGAHADEDRPRPGDVSPRLPRGAEHESLPTQPPRTCRREARDEIRRRPRLRHRR